MDLKTSWFCLLDISSDFSHAIKDTAVPTFIVVRPMQNSSSNDFVSGVPQNNSSLVFAAWCCFICLNVLFILGENL